MTGRGALGAGYTLETVFRFNPFHSHSARRPYRTRGLTILLVGFSSIAAAQQVEPDSVSSIAASPKAVSPAVSRPQMGWVLDTSAARIPAAFGTSSLESAGPGSSPAVARDGAGNIDGAALLGGLPAGTLLADYSLASANEASLSSGTTVLLLCGRENNWLRDGNGVLISPIAEAGQFSVTKAGEWGLVLASTISPFAVASGGKWVYANQPPTPTSYSHFAIHPGFPAINNSPICVWAFYDTSVKGSASQPEISVAYDDGPAGTPLRLPRPISLSAVPLEVVFSRVGADLGTLFVWQGTAARELFEQPVRSAYWNGGLRSSIDSQFETPDWNSLTITALDPRPIALGGDAQDNIHFDAYPAFVRSNPFAHYSVTVSAGTPFLAVRYQLGNAPVGPTEYSVSFTLDGEYMGYDQPWRYGTNLRSIPLPQDGRAHTLDLRNGFVRGNGIYAKPTEPTLSGGGFISAVAVPKGHRVTVNRPIPKSVAIVLSHSVAVGEAAGGDPYQDQGPQSSIAWPVQARAVKAFGTDSVVDESYGAEMLANECMSQTNCNNYLAAIKAAQPHITVGFVARMLNDFYHGEVTFHECLPQYQEMLGYLFTAWEEKFPGVPLYVGSDIRQSALYEAETDGCTPALKLADWRAGIGTAVNEYQTAHKAPWLHFVDMTDWVPQNQLLSGGIHPTAKGQVDICQAVADYFRQPVKCSVPQ